MQNYTKEKDSGFKYLSPLRFNLIYHLSINEPAWDVIGKIIGKDNLPISKAELLFVLSKTRKGDK